MLLTWSEVLVGREEATGRLGGLGLGCGGGGAMELKAAESLPWTLPGCCSGASTGNRRINRALGGGYSPTSSLLLSQARPAHLETKFRAMSTSASAWPLVLSISLPPRSPQKLTWVQWNEFLYCLFSLLPQVPKFKDPLFHG